MGEKASFSLQGSLSTRTPGHSGPEVTARAHWPSPTHAPGQLCHARSTACLSAPTGPGMFFRQEISPIPQSVSNVLQVMVPTVCISLGPAPTDRGLWEWMGSEAPCDSNIWEAPAGHTFIYLLEGWMKEGEEEVERRHRRQARGRRAGLVVAVATRNPGPFALFLSSQSSKQQKVVTTHPYLQTGSHSMLNKQREEKEPAFPVCWVRGKEIH